MGGGIALAIQLALDPPADATLRGSVEPVAAAAASDAAPQDYGLALAAAWEAFQADEFDIAMRYYERALALSGGAFEARLGVAWTLQRQGERAAARVRFEALALERPDDPAVQDGLALTEPLPRAAIEPYAGVAFQIFGAGSEIETGAGADVDVSLRAVEHLWLRATYRYVDFGSAASSDAGPGPMGGRNGVRRLDQHQVHAGLGAFWPRVGVAVHYAYADFSLGSDHQLHVPGVTARVSPWGDLLLEGSATLSERPVVGRTGLSFRMPVLKWLDLIPSGAVQFDRGDALPAGYLGLRFHGKPGAVAIGGKYGEERQPAYVGLAAIYSQRSPVRGGAWLSASAALPRGFALYAGYTLDWIELELASGEVDPSLNHAATLGIAWVSDWKYRP